MNGGKASLPDGRRKEFIKLAVGLSIPKRTVARFEENLEERGFTERGDRSQEINKALRLYLENVGAYEVVAEEERARAAEEAARREEEDMLGFFVEADDLD